MKIPKRMFDELAQYGREHLPYESCGILGGVDGQADRFFPCYNVEQSPYRYAISDEEIFRTMREMNRQGMEMVAIFHTHPNVVAYPSETDVRLAFYPDVLYLIMQLFEGQPPVMRSFHIVEGEITEEELIIEEDEAADVFYPPIAGASGSTETKPLLTESQMSRYSRQMILPEVGVQGQVKLLNSKVCIIGAGGLGSPVAIYLAAAGVGTIGIVDDDRVSMSNLHRQVLHFDHAVGQLKSRSARRHLEDLNPDIQVEEHNVRITSENAMEILAQYDVVINGSDNFPTRYLINDACVLLEKPLVDASILQWEGHLNVFMPGVSCYRCLYPEPPSAGTVPSCAEGGIIGAVAGVMGSMQALETVKILLGLENVLQDKTVMMDAHNGMIRMFPRRARHDCPICGESPAIHELIDYELFCGLPNYEPSTDLMPAALAAFEESGLDVSVSLAAQWYQDQESDAVWIDVREPIDYETGNIPGILHIPFYDIADRLNELPQDRRIVFVCISGLRSRQAVITLRGLGYNMNTYSLDGGMVAWENMRLPMEIEQ